MKRYTLLAVTAALGLLTQAHAPAGEKAGPPSAEERAKLLEAETPEQKKLREELKNAGVPSEIYACRFPPDGVNVQLTFLGSNARHPYWVK